MCIFSLSFQYIVTETGGENDQTIKEGIMSWQKIDSKSLYESIIACMAIREENLSLI